MSARQTLRGQTLHITRRTVDRRYFLSPSRQMVKVCEYAFAHGIEESGQEPHACVIMPSHPHSQNTDHNGRRSKFTEVMHGVIGRFGNGLLDRDGALWDNRRTSETVLLHDPDLPPFDPEEPEEFLKRIDSILIRLAVEKRLDIYQLIALYIWLNPIKAGLVDQVRQYPGFMVLPEDWGVTKTVDRPAAVSANYPAQVTYTPQPPPGRWSDMPLEEARADAEALIALAEDRYREARLRAGKRVLGPKALRNQNPWKQPAEMRLPLSQRRKSRRYSPLFSGHPEHVRKANLAYRAWARAHGVAGRKFRAGHHNVKFPEGSAGMQRLAGVRCRGLLAAENPMP